MVFSDNYPYFHLSADYVMLFMKQHTIKPLTNIYANLWGSFIIEYLRLFTPIDKQQKSEIIYNSIRVCLSIATTIFNNSHLIWEK